MAWRSRLAALARRVKVWGGGWLKNGHENFGTDLELSSTPVHEWHARDWNSRPAESHWC
jgi:hypothetical protein